MPRFPGEGQCVSQAVGGKRERGGRGKEALFTLILLYEHITEATLAWTASANGHRYSSCIVRSSTVELMVSRLSSCSLRIKCFAFAWMPTPCMPSMVSAMAMPWRYGSDPKPSQFLPPAGFLPSGPATGPRRTWMPDALVSSPMNLPRSRIRARSQVEAAWIPGVNALTLLP